jgi:glutathione S-transferase
VNEIEPRASTLMGNLVWNPPERRDLVVAQRSTEELKGPFGILEAHLNRRENLLGNEFTIADLNVASVSRALALMLQIDLSAWPSASRWLTRCLGRDAYGERWRWNERSASDFG